MSTMPGFDADASLYENTQRYYHTAAARAAASTRIVPQFGLCDKAAYYCNRGYERWCDVLDRCLG